MKQSLLFLACLFAYQIHHAQITTNGATWEVLGTTTMSLVCDDADNGDGPNDGAWFVDGKTNELFQGVQYVFDGTMLNGEVLNIQSAVYNTNNSFVRIAVELYNLDDGAVLVSSGTIGFPGSNTTPQVIQLSYQATAADQGDRLTLRYLRTSVFDDYRDFNIDNALLNGTFLPFYESTTQTGLTPNGTWLPIGNTVLKPRNDDGDNCDGVNDGSFFVNGKSTDLIQGAQCILDGNLTEGATVVLESVIFNVRVSYVKINFELYNITDDKVLASHTVSLPGNNLTPKTARVMYTATADDVGDDLAVRYMRIEVLHTFRDLSIDNLRLNGKFVPLELPLTGPGTPCHIEIIPDLPLEPSNMAIEAEIESAFERFSDSYLKTAPSETALNKAIQKYNALNITVQDGRIDGDDLSSFSDAKFIRVFARQLKFNPDDAATAEKLNNVVWLVSTQFCKGILDIDGNMYEYDEFARPAVLMQDYLTEKVQELFTYNLLGHLYDGGNHFWTPNYDAAFQEEFDGINTDLIYNIADALMAYATWFDTAEERYQYMRGFKRFMDRFFSYSFGTANGIKVDGSGFHHWTAYDHYMYAYATAADIISYLDGTSFQIEFDSYIRFRDAVYAQFVFSTQDGLKPISMSGRVIDNRESSLIPKRLEPVKRMSIAGGNILGFATPDPILAGLYNQRAIQPDPAFSYTDVYPNGAMDGFYQFNHAGMAIFRKKDWIAAAKGFTNYFWGTETYSGDNRYGRYQSYGALEILYPGDEENGLGWDLDTWNWNYNPGATTIVLPWDQLHAERGRLDERNDKRFAGALGFKNLGSELLPYTHTKYGVWAMDFQQREGDGFRETYGPNTHNATFKFKKSTFMMDGMIISLGSNISNDDVSNPTVTTLYQRLDNKAEGVLADGSDVTNSTLSENGDHWLISNYGTGFYVFAGSGDVHTFNGDQQTPNENQTDPTDYMNNPIGQYHRGYLNHGVQPQDESYEYIVLPQAKTKDMQNLQQDVAGGDKPYEVLQQNSSAHILSYKPDDIWGYVFFEPMNTVQHGLVESIDHPALLMYKVDNTTKEDLPKQIVLAVANPDLGYEWREYTPAIERDITIQLDGMWEFETGAPEASILSATESLTEIVFTTNNGLPVEVTLKRAASTGAPNLEIEKEDKILASLLPFPNPTSGKVALDFSDYENLPLSIELRDFTGKVLTQIDAISNSMVKFDISDQPSGAYLFKAYWSDGTYSDYQVHKK